MLTSAYTTTCTPLGVIRSLSALYFSSLDFTSFHLNHCNTCNSQVFIVPRARSLSRAASQGFRSHLAWHLPKPRDSTGTRGIWSLQSIVYIPSTQSQQPYHCLLFIKVDSSSLRCCYYNYFTTLPTPGTFTPPTAPTARNYCCSRVVSPRSAAAHHSSIG